MRDIDDEDYNDDAINEDGQFSNLLYEWFNNGDDSPLKCRKNLIKKYRTEHGRIVYGYERKDEDISTLYVSTKAIKSCPFKFAGVELVDETVECNDVLNESDEECDTLTKIEQHKENAMRAFNNLCIYGHHLDVDNRFGTRFDSEFLNDIAREFETKFDNITIHGAFESVGDLISVIDALYDNLCTKRFDSRIRIHLDSKIKDDDGNVKTLANMIANSYVTPNIVKRDNITDIVYTKFDKNMTAKFYVD